MEQTSTQPDPIFSKNADALPSDWQALIADITPAQYSDTPLSGIPIRALVGHCVKLLRPINIDTPIDIPRYAKILGLPKPIVSQMLGRPPAAKSASIATDALTRDQGQGEEHTVLEKLKQLFESAAKKLAADPTHVTLTDEQIGRHLGISPQNKGGPAAYEKAIADFRGTYLKGKSPVVKDIRMLLKKQYEPDETPPEASEPDAEPSTHHQSAVASSRRTQSHGRTRGGRPNDNGEDS